MDLGIDEGRLWTYRKTNAILKRVFPENIKPEETPFEVESKIDQSP